MTVMHGHRGFTVIELALALVATGLVAALIVSAVRTYSVRAEVASGVQLATPWRSLVEVGFRHAGHVPSGWEDLNAGPVAISSIYVDSVELVDGRLDIVYGNEAAAAISGKRLSLTPYETADQAVVWVCGNDVPGVGLQPLGFALGGAQSVQIPPTIASRYLPAGCR
jgi:Tfp pilus assembly major pilin PilA